MLSAGLARQSRRKRRYYASAERLGSKPRRPRSAARTGIGRMDQAPGPGVSSVPLEPASPRRPALSHEAAAAAAPPLRGSRARRPAARLRPGAGRVAARLPGRTAPKHERQ